MKFSEKSFKKPLAENKPLADKKPLADNKPLEQVDPSHYYMENGFKVFTEAYHLARGNCCGNDCRHCPYDRINVVDRTS